MKIVNPIFPLNECIPDGEPHVFGDRVYLFGSHDMEVKLVKEPDNEYDTEAIKVEMPGIGLVGGISDAQLRFVMNSMSGMGLLKCGNVVIPFDNKIGKDTDLYRLYNTNLLEKIAERRREKTKY